ncbi:glycosyltransferase family 2 protein [Algoriphagus kandeliae]|uniref:Glycosyltransferase family 2 protein n=1 Tax=Algoriphagus kandeliae TaxID=2562278 RepID=A0A4Y9QPT2_9BACT|nr:glycosyltransferase family 2 protein [Algoriphagus kandeliae]TFV94651.1 glycosyltransferase family 2 protein [Algoriphagus kandeliae]
MKTCAIVILNYNGEEMLARFLPSVVTNSQFDIWVIDNASTDQSIAFLEKEFPHVFLEKLNQNFGYAGGYNRGLEKFKGSYQYYILLNSDVEVTQGWDVTLINYLQENQNLAAVQPKILSAVDRHQFDYAGAGGGFLDSLYYPYCRGRIWNQIETDEGQYDDDCLVDWTSGACFAIRSDLFHELKGFDDHFFAHMEEIDLCLRIRQLGFDLAYTSKSTIYHLGGATLDRSSPKKLELNIRNSLSMIYKNLPASSFWWVFIQKGILELIAGIGYFFQGKSHLGKAVFQGYVGFFRQRSIFTPGTNKKKIPFLGPSSYVFIDFFFRRRKKFSEL